MKVYLLVTVLFFHLSVFGQDSTGTKRIKGNNEKKNELYFSLLSGYGIGTGVGVNSQTQGSLKRNFLHSYGKGFNLSLAGGIMFSSNLGVEMNIGFHYGGRNKVNNIWYYDTSNVRSVDQQAGYSGKYVLFNPNLLIAAKNKGVIIPYLKMGPVLALGSGLSEYENKVRFRNGSQGTEKYEWVWKGGSGIGVNSSVGLKIRTKNEKAFFVIEATYTSLGISFKEGERINNSYQNLGLTSPLTVSETQTVFVDKVDEKKQDPGKPFQQLKFKSNANSLAIEIGFYIVIS